MTALQAIQQAQQTGQIAITKRTAKLFAIYLEIRNKHNEFCTEAASYYADPDAEFDGLHGRLQEPLERYLGLCSQEIFGIITDGLWGTEFKGL